MEFNLANLPSLGRSAGARLTVIRLAGSARPEATSAARTRSLASLTALSGNPTMAKCSRPGATWTCTSTARASMPSNATVVTRWTMPLPPLASQSNASVARRKEHLGNGQAPGVGDRHNEPLAGMLSGCLARAHFVDAPGAWARGRQIQKDEAEQDRRVAAVDGGKETSRRVHHEVSDRHLARHQE